MANTYIRDVPLTAKRHCRGALSRWLGLLLLLAGSAAISATGHEYYFTRIDGPTSGLAQNGVHVLFQDRQGFVWIGTEGGLNRFDGYALQRHHHDPNRADSLPSGLITALADANGDDLWVGTQTGRLLRYDPHHHRVLERHDGRAGHMIGALFRDKSQRLWVGDMQGISVLEPGKSELHAVYQVQSQLSNFYSTSITGFAQCPDGRLYASSSDGLLVIDTLAAKPLGRKAPANDVLCDQDNRLFVTTESALLQVNRDTGQATTLWQANSAAGGQVWQMAEDHRGQLWVVLRGQGLLKLDPDGSHVHLLKPLPHQLDSLPDAMLTRLMVDRSGLVWVGTETQGAAHTLADGSAVDRLINDNPALDREAANNVRAIFQDSQQRYWVGTRGAGLQQFLPSERRFVDANAALRKAMTLGPRDALSVHAIAAAAAGSQWLATDRGVLLFDPASDTARRLDLGKPPGQRDRYRDILVDTDGSLWLAGLDSGLLHYRVGAGVIARYGTADGLADKFVFNVARDSKGRLWVGMLRGLSLFDPLHKHFRSFAEDPNRRDSLAGLRVTDLRTDGNGALWISTDAGINKLLHVDAAGLHVQRILHSNGLPDSMAYCALDDQSGHIWVPSNLGVSSVGVATGGVRTLTPADGLQGLEFNTAACLRDKQGLLWFGGVRGLNRLDPKDLVASDFMPPTVVTGVQYGNHTALLNGTSVLSIPQQARVVRFTFASLDFARPVANRFRYRMIGVDKNWISNGTDNRVTYTNLKPGHYQFEVSGSNRDGIYNPRPDIVRLEILPPWWNTVAAHIAAVLMAAMLLGLLLLAWYRRHRIGLRHRAEIREHDERLRLALWGSGDQFWDVDLHTMVLRRIGPNELTGGPSEQSYEMSDWREQQVHPEDIDAVERLATEHLEGRLPAFESEHRVRNADGEWIWVRARGKIVDRDDGGKPSRIAGTIHRIDNRRSKELERRIAASVIHSMAEAVAVTDLDFRFVSTNPAFTRMIGYEQDEIVGMNAGILNCSQHSAAMYRQLRDMVRNNGHWRGELWQKRKDGEEFLSWIEVTAVHDQTAKRSHYVSVMSDITMRKRTEQELRYLANYDALTGLPNRTLLSQRLGYAINMAQKVNHKVAVLFIDLDRFKQVNDSMGHTIGDRMLKAAGARLRANVREVDIVARLGGDEFSVVLENVQSTADAKQVCEGLIAAFEQPLRLDTGQEISTSPSIGIALYPDHGNTPGDLLKFADTAMYQAKSNGRNTWALYTAAMDAQARHHATLLTSLRMALQHNELYVVYQPKLDIESWRITGVEALLRWQNRHLGNIPPSTFIPLAEEAGLISEIGEFVLNMACSNLAKWRARGITDVGVAVNISSAQLLGHRLLDHIRQALARSGVPAHMLELELTEGLVMSDAEVSLRNLRELKELGLVLSIDDFGTGYSSLAYLKRLPIDILKIDKEFVGDITEDPDDEAITATIISIAHTLGLDVIAEGVETFQQIVYLAEKDCDEIQGNWFSPPLPATECFALLCRHDPMDRPHFPLPE